MINRISLAVILASALACNSNKAEPVVASAVDKEQIKKEIQAKENEFADTYNSGVLKNIGYYADDAISFYQNRAPLVGRPAIAEFLQDGISSSTNKIEFKTGDVFVSNDGNMVVEIGYFTVYDSTKAAINSGHYMSLFEKRNGKYVCVRDMSASENLIEQ